MNNISLVPHVSEKSIALAEKRTYIFDVPAAANKIEVARSVAAEFKVEVVGVNMLVHKGKLKRFKRQLGRQRDTKKAMVTIKKGQSIKIFEGAS